MSSSKIKKFSNYEWSWSPCLRNAPVGHQAKQETLLCKNGPFQLHINLWRYSQNENISCIQSINNAIKPSIHLMYIDEQQAQQSFEIDESRHKLRIQSLIYVHSAQSNWFNRQFNQSDSKAISRAKCISCLKAFLIDGNIKSIDYFTRTLLSLQQHI